MAASAPGPAVAPRRASRRALEDEPATPNYALRLTEGLPDAGPAESHDSFARRLNEALEAINAANGVKTPAAEALSHADLAAAPAEALSQPASASVRGWLAALDKLPPIRLPIGPAIPWKIGLPALVALVVLMGVTSRTLGAAEPQGVQLPAQQTYPVQDQAPLFAKPQAIDPSNPSAAGGLQASDLSDTRAAGGLQASELSDTSAASLQTTDPSDTSAATAQAAEASGTSATTAPTQQQAIGVPEAAALGGFDLLDIGIKLVAVLGLAYASLMLLKKIGFGGAGLRAGSSGAEVRVVSSVVLAPNRSVHVIALPGGKTLLVGATPTAVNLLAELPTLLA